MGKAQQRWGWNAAAKRMGISFEEYSRHRNAGDYWCPRCAHWKPIREGFYLRRDNGKPLRPCKACKQREIDAWRERQAGRLK